MTSTRRINKALCVGFAVCARLTKPEFHCSMTEFPLIPLERIDSTNRLAREYAAQGVAHGTTVVARFQTDGRGRLHKKWFSPPGTGLFFSLVARPAITIGDYPKVSLAAGLAIGLHLEKMGVRDVRLKWPNDILIRDRKAAGILLEGGESAGGPFCIIGVGLNVLSRKVDFPEQLHAKATSLYLATGRTFFLPHLLTGCVHALLGAVAQMEAGGFSEILRQWKKRDALVDRHMQWLTPTGVIVRGTSLGPDDDGVLHIRDANGRRHQVLSGDITLLPSL